MKKIKFFILPILMATITALLSGCSENVGDTLKIAVPYPFDLGESTGYENGIILAEEDIKARNISVEILREDDGGDFSKAISLAQKYISDSNVVGVVGHFYSDICVPISELYKTGKKVLIVPTVSVSSLMKKDVGWIFRNIQSDNQIVQKMVDYAVNVEVENAVIYYEDSVYGFRTSASLEVFAENNGIKIVDKVCSPSSRELPFLWADWKALGIDSIFVISNPEEGIELVNTMVELGYDGAFIGSDGMDNPETAELISEKANIAVCTTYNSENPNAELSDFLARYEKRFGEEGSVWAAQAYDCIMMIANAIEKGTASSDELRVYLTETGELDSIYGKPHFDEAHEIKGRNVYIKTLKNKKFTYLKDN